jgi:cell division protein FtsI (penicillin-binding protein 3)
MLKIDDSQLKWLHVRMIVVGVLLAVAFWCVFRRAYELQVVQRQKFRAMAEEQYLRDVELPPRRGTIFDRVGARLATSADVDSIYANPRMIGDDAAHVAARLAPLVHADRKDLERRLSSGRYFVWIARRVTPDTAERVRALHEPGIEFTQEPKRFYPSQGLAGPLLGFADADAHGIEGVELALDQKLRGERIAAPGVRDALGRDVVTGGLPDADAAGGSDVQLTIDRFIQFAAERALAAAIAKNRAKDGSVTVMDPRTGEVLAMASWPSYDPNDPRDIAKRGARNRPVTDAYEPGSTVKTFSVAAAIDAGVVRPTDEWDCQQGKAKIGGITIHDTHPYGGLNTAEVVAKSSNIGAAKIGHRLGRERLDAFLRNLGFARPTGIELPGEGAGRLRKVEHWTDSELTTIAFGQGVTATPLQLLQGLTAIADGGILHPPRIVKQITGSDARITTSWQPSGRRVMSAASAQTMVDMLKLVTEKGGTAEGLIIPGYKIAGKTGTAQKVDPATRRYSTDKWVSSFLGFVPAEEPRLAMLVVIDEPSGSHYGSTVAGPVFRDIAEQAMKYLGVPPRAEDALVVAAKPATAGSGPRASAKSELGTGRIGDLEPPAQQPGERRALDADTTADVDLTESDDDAAFAAATPEGTSAFVPDFTGMSMAEAVTAARRAHLQLDAHGSGRAVGQEPGPGPVSLHGDHGKMCHVQFRPPG